MNFWTFIILFASCLVGGALGLCIAFFATDVVSWCSQRPLRPGSDE